MSPASGDQLSPDRRTGLLDGDGVAAEHVIGEVLARRQRDIDPRSARSFGLTYRASAAVDDLLTEAARIYALDNALSPAVVPSLAVMQADIVAATVALVGGGDDVAGAITSGGTESIFLAVKTACAIRQHDVRHTRGTLVLPATAHPAFEKACDVFGLTPVRVPVAAGRVVCVDEFTDALSDETVLAVGSAPSYPWGMVDEIPALAAAAAARAIPFHVDACIGGYLLPFVERLGVAVTPWDFRVSGVTSLSADVHKYGYGIRGTSVLLHRPAENSRHQAFAFSDWPGGRYATPTLLGSRPAAPIAAAWSVMRHLGCNGYIDLTSKALSATAQLCAAVTEHPGLFIVGEPVASVIAIGSECHDILAVGSRLRDLGWHLEHQSPPRALHLMIAPAHLEVIDEFVADLRRALADDAGDTSAAPATYGDDRSPAWIGTLPEEHDI